MTIDDLLFGNALCARRTDVVRVQNLEHVRTGVTHQSADRQNAEGDRRQNEVFRNIQKLHERRQTVIKLSLHTGQIEPAELDGEYIFQYRCQEEGRQRNTDHRKDCREVVQKTVLLLCRKNAQRDRNKNFNKQGHYPKRKAVPDRIAELLRYRNRPSPAVAPFSSQRRAEPSEIAPYDTLIHTVLALQIVEPFGRALARAGSGCKLLCLRLQIAARHVVQQGVDQEHDEEQYYDAI